MVASTAKGSVPMSDALELLERGDDGEGLPFQRGLADAVEAFVGVELDEDEVGAGGVGDEGLEAGDLHAIAWSSSAR